MLEYCKPILLIFFILLDIVIFVFIFPPDNENIPLQILVAFSTTLGVYILLPILFYSCPAIQRFLIFQHNIKRPRYVDFSDPVTEGVTGARNIYVDLDDGSLIGVWHILPRSLISNFQYRKSDEKLWDKILRTSKKPIVVYLHGNTGSRALDHRKELYKVLQNLDFHIICCDYRGYADSSPVSPSETGVVNDGIAVYKWLRNIVGVSNEDVEIFIWGHSLGSGISAHIVAKLCIEGDKPKGLILESPFTSLGESIRYHKIAAPYAILPAFERIFVEPLKRNDIGFENDRHIADIDIPIAILHCEDDQVVPFLLGRKLFDIGKTVRSADAKPIFFKGFDKGYAHKFICRSPELPGFLRIFIDCCVRDDWNTSALQQYS